MSMNINTEPGSQVIVTAQGLMNGQDQDKRQAKRHLIQDMTYTVESIKTRFNRTQVKLQEVPYISFNSVHFENK